MTPRSARVLELRRSRPRSRFVRVSAFAFVAFGVVSLWSLRGGFADLFSGERLEVLGRFFTRDAWPYELRGEPFSLTGLFDWIAAQWHSQGRAGAVTTLWIATVAIVAAGAVGSLLAYLGARELAQRDPFLSQASDKPVAWRGVTASLVRGLSTLMRAVPEYVLAYLALALLGANAWPAVIALAIHNAGILGRLGAETIENLDRRPLGALRSAGATRPAMAIAGIVPAALGRSLLYFFYRYETCIREATVLGMLGIASLGAFVQEARARQRYDELLFLVGVAAALVLAVDVLSQAVRRWVRGA
ncbi:MAG: ABC transporter permease subunit [Planctomycetota bacterium]